jgi:hypothetical protein
LSEVDRTIVVALSFTSLVSPIAATYLPVVHPALGLLFVMSM